MKQRLNICFLILILFLSGAVTKAENNNNSWVLTANDVHADYTGAPVANGTIGVLPWKEPFSIRHIILNHIFELNDATGVNRIIKAINPFNLKMILDGEEINVGNIQNWNQKIDLKRAIHTTSFTVPGKLEVSYDVVAPRCLPFCAWINIRLKALQNVNVKLNDSVDIPQDEYRNASTKYHEFKAGGKYTGILGTRAETAHGRYGISAGAMFIAGKSNLKLTCTNNKTAHAELALKAGQETSLALAASVCTTHDFSDPYSETERELIYINLQTIEKLMEQHEKLWEELWQGDIEIDGDDEAQRVVRFALYNLYSYCREGTALSISPMGLSSRGYNGHIFWDSEIWMYPPLLLMNQGIAKSMIEYRINRLEAAKTRAASNGYKGAMFPWESDDFGQESTPSWATTGQFEHHITADIAFAAWNYYCVTRDKKWLEEKGWPLIEAAAQFWESRVEKNTDGSYSINNVVGADEYAEGVDDNAYTNGSAITALQCAVKAARVVGAVAPKSWTDIANNIRILKMPDGVTAEYKGYNGKMIKQGDANLLAYPFSVVTDKEQIKKDMAYYDDKIDKQHGPAMAFGVFSVIYSRLGDRDKAEAAFRRSYRPNMRPPFGVFAETPSSHNPYFATGAGSMLQGVINGFGGLKITDQGIKQVKSVLPKGWKKLTLRGIGPERKTYIVNGEL